MGCLIKIYVIEIIDFNRKGVKNDLRVYIVPCHGAATKFVKILCHINYAIVYIQVHLSKVIVY
jgi:hypothetical protein